MTRRSRRRSVRILGATALLAVALPAVPAAVAAAAAPPDAISAHPRLFGATPDISARDDDGNLVVAHQPGATASAAARSDYPQVSVTLRVTLPDDPAPSKVAATMVNTDDARRFAATFAISHGVQRLSVPKGNYSVLVFSLGTDHATHVHVVRMAFAVDQHLTTSGSVITVDQTAATEQGFPSYSTPADPTKTNQVEFYTLEDGRGRNIAGIWEVFSGPRDQLLVTGTPGGTHGRLISANETAELGSGSDIYYLSTAQRNAVIGNENVSVPTSALTRVERHYYTDGTEHRGYAARTAVYPFFDPGGESFLPVRVPGVRDEYLYAPRGAVWLNDVEVSTADGGYADLAGFAQYQRGADVREDMWRGPLAPGVVSQPPGARTYPTDGPRTCWACRTANGMSVGLAPVVGSEPNFGGVMFAGPGQRPHETHLTVYRDDVVVADGFNASGSLFSGFPAQFATPSGEHDYRIVQTTDRAVDGMSLSTLATTEYDFSSSATSGARLDPGWDCAAPGTGPCRVLPLLSVQVPLPTSLTGSLPSGFSFVIVDVGHAQGAAATPITAFDLAIRNGTGKWEPQTVESLGGGHYYVAIHNTAASGTPVSMRWHATDAAGSAITQTVRKAYTIGN